MKKKLFIFALCIVWFSKSYAQSPLDGTYYGINNNNKRSYHEVQVKHQSGDMYYFKCIVEDDSGCMGDYEGYFHLNTALNAAVFQHSECHIEFKFYGKRGLDIKDGCGLAHGNRCGFSANYRRK
jgi:hypothetical protein